MDQLAGFARPEQRRQLDKLEDYLREACPGPSSDQAGSHGRLLTDSVTFAIMRRISRESFYTARVIDLSARLMNEILGRIPGCTRVHVEDVDRLDRPTLKALARAVLLVEQKHGFSWVWHSMSDPLASPAGSGEGLFLASRKQLLRQLAEILSPTLCREAEPIPLSVGHGCSPAAIDQVSAALVLQNYDACFLWLEPLLQSCGGPELAEGLRLLSLATVNIGRIREALEQLSLAEEKTDRGGRRAHLCYLQGLIEAKRGYDLAASTSHYQRGLAALGQGGAGEDLPLEQGWLLNGLALNEAILWRRNAAAVDHFHRAFSLERDAFGLVAEGKDPARTYLRFNLLANTTFLLEIQGNYPLAIDTFKKVFELELEDASEKRERWRSTVGYRIGVLHFRAGALEEAHRCLCDAAEQDSYTESWATQERILRARGLVELDLGSPEQAAGTFSQGLQICREARSAEGAREHGRGLLATLLANGKMREARDLAGCLASEEGVDLVSEGELDRARTGAALRPRPPSPKLPAYFPEIDLEGIPCTDLNRFLGKAQDRDQVVPWRD